MHRFVLIVIVVGGVLFIGCVGQANDATWTVTPPCSGASGPAATSEPSPTTGTGSVASISNASAKEWALCAEERYLRTTLDSAGCLNEWGTSATVVEETATVLNRTADAIYLDIRHPYWFSKGSLSDDGFSEATYLVTSDLITRTEGDAVAPCQ